MQNLIFDLINRTDTPKVSDKKRITFTDDLNIKIKEITRKAKLFLINHIKLLDNFFQL